MPNQDYRDGFADGFEAGRRSNTQPWETIPQPNYDGTWKCPKCGMVRGYVDMYYCPRCQGVTMSAAQQIQPGQVVQYAEYTVVHQGPPGPQLLLESK